ncbi:HET-domain-containing protein, partial [Massariosphaeria phaeospora]
MYPFKPLNDSDIRTVIILPAVDTEAEIRCELYHREFDPGTYSALSYVWGNPNPRKTIYIEDTAVEVTPNLFAALRSLRHTSSKVCLWVDALCINQDDVLEKRSQVKRMTEIYAEAMTVFMWLGEEEGDSDLAMALLHRLEKELRGNFIRTNEKATLMTLLGRPYWFRVWIIQEIVTAHHAI